MRLHELRRSGSAALAALALSIAAQGQNEPAHLHGLTSPLAIASDPQGAPFVAGADGRIVHLLEKSLAVPLADTGGQPAGLAFDAQGTLYAADEKRRAILAISPSGAVSVLADRCDGEPFLTPAHIAGGPGGILYFSDTKASRIFRADTRGQLRPVHSTVSGPRGIVASADGRWLYVADSARRIWKLSTDGKHQALFAALDGEGDAGGMALDEEGNLYVARDGGGVISVLSRGGRPLAPIPVPVKRVTGIAFGGPELKTLYAIGTEKAEVYRLAVGRRCQLLPWEPDPRFRIVQPVDGAILNRHDGEAAGDSLRIAVKGEARGARSVRVNGVAVAVRGGRFQTDVVLRERETTIRVQAAGATREAKVIWDRGSFPRYRLSLDDNIWFLKDIAQHAGQYRSIFENPYLAFWRELHQQYGTKVHFNIYYETDGFNLSQMPEKFRAEWQRNQDWIRLSFHARADDPDRPYLHASPEQVAGDYRLVMREIERFAGKELLGPVTTIHWGAATRPAVQALRAEGVRVLVGYFEPWGDAPIVSYYLPLANWQYLNRRDYWKDTQTDVLFVKHDMVMNLYRPEEIVPRLEQIAADPHQSEIIELMIHEQYFYPHYRYYEPDYRERVRRALAWVTAHGYRPVFFGEGFLGNPGTKLEGVAAK